MQIMVAILAVCCIILFVQNWQLKEQLNQQQNELKEFKLAVSGELQAINESAQRQYDILYKKVLKDREDSRLREDKILSLLTKLSKYAAAINNTLEINTARLDEKVDASEQKVNEEIGDNQRKVNDSIRSLAELFVNEITKSENRLAKLENETQLMRKQLEAAPAMIENKVHVETEYHHHHHHQAAEYREPTLGERIGQIVGGVIQSGATYLLSKAIGLQ
jgi:hypothetical protein